MEVLYFAWMREKVGHATETLALPADVTTVAELARHLANLSPGHASAFANPGAVRTAVNQDFATPETPVSDGDEVAFFPPVTGG